MVPREQREFEEQFAGARVLSLAPGGAHTTVVTTCCLSPAAAGGEQVRQACAGVSSGEGGVWSVQGAQCTR